MVLSVSTFSPVRNQACTFTSKGRTGEAKFWVEPNIELAQNYGLTARQMNSALRAIREHENEIREAWAAILEVGNI
jgi:hypothetical protein